MPNATCFSASCMYLVYCLSMPTYLCLQTVDEQKCTSTIFDAKTPHSTVSSIPPFSSYRLCVPDAVNILQFMSEVTLAKTGILHVCCQLMRSPLKRGMLVLWTGLTGYKDQSKPNVGFLWHFFTDCSTLSSLYNGTTLEDITVVLLHCTLLNSCNSANDVVLM